MLEIDWTNAFKKDLKKLRHSEDLVKELNLVIEQLANLKPLLPHHKDHGLSGNWVDHRECHVKNDLLLIYRKDKTNLILIRLGSHSELF